MNINQTMELFSGKENITIHESPYGTTSFTDQRLYMGTLRNIPDDLKTREVVKIILEPEYYLGMRLLVL